MNKVLLIIYNLYISILLLNNILILLNLKKNIFKTILTLVLAINKLFPKNI